MKRKQVITLLTTLTIIASTVAGCGNTSATMANLSENTCTETADEAAVEYDYDIEEEVAEYDYGTEEVAESRDYSVEQSLSDTAMMSKEDESYLDSVYDYNNDDVAVSTGNEEYSDLEEIGFKSVKRSPLSTFAADVDTASYSNFRRLINQGYSLDDIPYNSVRIEEFINYFNYDYSGPKGSEPFGVNVALGNCPWNDRAKLLSIGLKTEDIDFEKTPDSNLVFLIDVSGSMFSEDKLPLLQDAFCMLVDELSEKDHVSIVTYAGEDSVVLKGASGDQKKKIKAAIRDLEAGGSTNGSAGIKTAYQLAEKYFIEGGNNRVILATDGDLNVGLTSVDELERLISNKKESGVFLSVLGFGSGNLKDNRMETLADKGNGNYAYIDSEREAKKVLVTELSANMLTICKDVKFQLEFNEDAVKGYRLVGYANRVMANRDFNDDTKDGGEIGAGHTVTVLYELIMDDEWEEENLCDLNIRFKRPDADESELLVYNINSEIYDKHPSDDFIFQGAVAEFGLLASQSEYMEDASVMNVIDSLESIDLNDEFKEEFLELVYDAR